MTRAIDDSAQWPQAYAELWDTLHAAPGEPWADNPEVVAIEFGRAK